MFANMDEFAAQQTVHKSVGAGVKGVMVMWVSRPYLHRMQQGVSTPFLARSMATLGGKATMTSSLVRSCADCRDACVAALQAA